MLSIKSLLSCVERDVSSARSLTSSPESPVAQVWRFGGAHLHASTLQVALPQPPKWRQELHNCGEKYLQMTIIIPSNPTTSVNIHHPLVITGAEKRLPRHWCLRKSLRHWPSKQPSRSAIIRWFESLELLICVLRCLSPATPHE